MKKLSLNSLSELRESLQPEKKNWVRVGMSTCGIAAGAQKVYDLLKEEVARRGLEVSIEKTGCLGMCHIEPLVEVNVEGVPSVVYGRVDAKAALGIVNKHLCGKRLMNDHIVIR